MGDENRFLLPPSIVVALGLASCVGGDDKGLATADTGTPSTHVTFSACLMYIVEPTADTGVTTVSPCLAPVYQTPSPTPASDSADTGLKTHSGDTGLPTSSAVFERLTAEDVLPPDVLDRLLDRQKED